jgi:DNA-directed RNA polymerase subunit K/omega
MVNTQSRKFTRIAQEEVALGLVKYDIETVSKAVPKKRASKEGKGH